MGSARFVAGGYLIWVDNTLHVVNVSGGKLNMQVSMLCPVKHEPLILFHDSHHSKS